MKQSSTITYSYQIIALIACGLAMHQNTVAQFYPHTDSANLGNWILQEQCSDEFDGTTLNENKWQVCGRDGVYWAGQFKGRTYNTANTGGVPGGWQYSPDNLRVTNGMLRITTEYDPDYPWYEPGTNVWTHTTGGMWSKAVSAPTGYMEIRCKLADASVVGAFWTTAGPSSPNCEIDVFEGIGSPTWNTSRIGKMWSSLHDWSMPNPNSAWTETTQLPFDFKDGFHTYAAEWGVDFLKIYADGVLIHETTKDWVENTPIGGHKYSTTWPLPGGQHIWADAEIFEWWGVPTEVSLPADHEIEYIRVWERGPPLPTTPWQDFVQDYGLPGDKDAHSDADVLTDWGEYAFGGDPTNPADIGFLPEFDPITGEYLFQVRNDTTLVAHVVSKTNLLDISWTTNDSVVITNANGEMGTHATSVGLLENNLFIKLIVDEYAPSYPTPTYHLLIAGAIGNGDFESGSPAAGGHPYQNTPNWFNASGAEDINFIIDSQMNGSSQPASHGGMPFQGRVQINNTGYTIVAPGEVFSLRYDFGAGGSPASWDGDEIMRTFLFTSSTTVDDNTILADMTELGGDSYPIDRATDGQWTTRTDSTFYTTSEADVGKTVYLGIEFVNPAGATLYPRIDVVNLEVNKQQN